MREMDTSLRPTPEDDRIKITVEVMNTGDLFMCQYIDSEEGVWSSVESKVHLLLS